MKTRIPYKVESGPPSDSQTIHTPQVRKPWHSWGTCSKSSQTPTHGHNSIELTWSQCPTRHGGPPNFGWHSALVAVVSTLEKPSHYLLGHLFSAQSIPESTPHALGLGHHATLTPSFVQNSISWLWFLTFSIFFSFLSTRLALGILWDFPTRWFFFFHITGLI